MDQMHKDTIEFLKHSIVGLKKLATLEEVATDGEYTDFIARLNIVMAETGDLHDTLKSRIKTHLLKVDRTISEGAAFMAILQRTEVTRLNTEKVKQFLGKRLGDYQVTSPEVKLLFRAKA